jgi:hypothetical protein
VIDVKLSGLVKQAGEIASDLARSRPKSFEIPASTPANRVPFKAKSCREMMLIRTSELASGAVDSLKRKRPVVAATLTRSVMESMAKAHELQRILDDFVIKPEGKDLDAALMQYLFGSRNNSNLPNATNILTAIDRTEKMIPHFRENYDRLSELAHPNFLGGLGAFVELDLEQNSLGLTNPKRKNDLLVMVAGILIGTLHGFVVFYNHVGGSIQIIQHVFDAGLVSSEI